MNVINSTHKRTVKANGKERELIKDIDLFEVPCVSFAAQHKLDRVSGSSAPAVCLARSNRF